MIILNFNHPLSDEALRGLGEWAAEDLDVRHAQVQLDLRAPLGAQVEKVVDRIQLSTKEWATVPLLVVLPGMAAAAALVLAIIHGRRGGFVPIVHLVRREDGVFRFGQVIDLSGVRERARLAR